MIQRITNKTEKHVLEELVDIHKKCILMNSSKFYNKDQILEWISLIDLNSVEDQLKNTSWIIYKEGEKIVAFAQYSIKDLFIYQMQVLPSKQGKGIGKTVYQFIENEFRKEEKEIIKLYSTLNAVPFYRKMGFKTIGNIEYELIEGSVRLMIMEKVLN
jgi:GNAT superfamily N-acetyltransferase